MTNLGGDKLDLPLRSRGLLPRSHYYQGSGPGNSARAASHSDTGSFLRSPKNTNDATNFVFSFSPLDAGHETDGVPLAIVNTKWIVFEIYCYLRSFVPSLASTIPLISRDSHSFQPCCVPYAVDNP